MDTHLLAIATTADETSLLQAPQLKKLAGDLLWELFGLLVLLMLSLDAGHQLGCEQ